MKDQPEPSAEAKAFIVDVKAARCPHDNMSAYGCDVCTMLAFDRGTQPLRDQVTQAVSNENKKLRDRVAELERSYKSLDALNTARDKEILEALQAIPNEFVQSDAWQNANKRWREARDRLRSDLEAAKKLLGTCDICITCHIDPSINHSPEICNKQRPCPDHDKG